ncbi:hypothetical protein BZZ01_19915 [Nostocales cyanobacterium HT-58-2]|nr:hypothetical protein BZZ01_19915 [Nostocales cyanobacterium HT-58-2]
MDQDTWIYTNKRPGNLVLRFRVKGFEKQFFVGTSLADKLRNRELVGVRRVRTVECLSIA